MARPASDISERILAAARERFLSEGVDGASLRAIAKDAGTNLGMIYYYYPTKDELFAAVVEGAYARILGEIGQLIGAHELDTQRRIETLYRYFAALPDDDLKVVRLIFREALTSSERLRSLFARFTRGHIPLVVGMMSRGVEAGEVRDDQPLLVLALSMLVVGLMPQVLRRRVGEAAPESRGFFPDAQVLASSLAAIMVRGLSPLAGSVPPAQPEPARRRKKGA